MWQTWRYNGAKLVLRYCLPQRLVVDSSTQIALKKHAQKTKRVSNKIVLAN